MQRELDLLLPEIHRFAPNCPDPLAFACILTVARQACERALFWRCTEDIEISSTEAEGVCSIVDAAIIRIQAASMDGNPLEPVAISWLDEHHPHWDRDYSDNGPARYITQLHPNTVSLYPKITGTVTARLILKPARRAATLPSFMIEQYAEILGKGAASEVLLTPDEKVAKPELGVALRMEFREWLDGINYKEARGQQRGKLRTKGQFL